MLHTTVDVAPAFVVTSQLRTDDRSCTGLVQVQQVLYINDAMRPVLLKAV